MREFVKQHSKKHVLVALVQDRPGVLNRAVSLFRRRGLNIESLTVGRTETPGISKMTWVVEAESVTPIIAQLKKLIEVLEVHEEGGTETGSGKQPRPSFNPTVTPFLFTGLSQADGIL